MKIFILILCLTYIAAVVIKSSGSSKTQTNSIDVSEKPIVRAQYIERPKKTCVPMAKERTRMEQDLSDADVESAETVSTELGTIEEIPTEDDEILIVDVVEISNEDKEENEEIVDSIFENTLDDKTVFVKSCQVKNTINMDLDVEELVKSVGKHVMSDEETALLYKVTEEIEKNSIDTDSVLVKMVQSTLFETKTETGEIQYTKTMLGIYAYKPKEVNPLVQNELVAHVFIITE